MPISISLWALGISLDSGSSGIGAGSNFNILQEDDFDILLEDDSFILLEDAT